MTSALIQAEQITLKRDHKTVLDNISLSILPRQIVTLIGPNGCGKSTLIKALLKLETVDSGNIKHKAGLRIGYMPQKLSLDERMPMDVWNFLSLTRDVHSKHIRHWLKRLKIEELTS